jgi:hypothetical protein
LFEIRKKCKNMQIITSWPWTAADEIKTQQPTKNRRLQRRRGWRGGTEEEQT